MRAATRDLLSVGTSTVGHAPSLSGRGLQAYLAAGIGSDHGLVDVVAARLLVLAA